MTMPEFDRPRDTWNARYAGDEYLLGETPNAFLLRHARQIPAGGSVLCVADGEGRNSVWLAEQGYRVTAFDFASNGVAKAHALAARRTVSLDLRLGDMETWVWEAVRYDALAAIFIQFLPPERRDEMFRHMQSAVKPGGILLLEGYRPEQVDYATGGPPYRDHMYTRAWLEQCFRGWEIVTLDAYDAHLSEGRAHHGMSALIDLVARKPA